MKDQISLIILLFVGLANMATAQEIVFSNPQKLSNKTPQFKMLGKSNEGVIIYKYGKNNRIIEAYNNNLKLRWKRSLTIKHSNPRVKKIVLYPEQSLLFYTSQAKGASLLFGEKLNSKFQSNNNFLLIDTLQTDRYDISSQVKVITSQNQAIVVAYYPIYIANQLDRMKLIGLSKNLEVLFEQEIPLGNKGPGLEVKTVFPDNNGNVYFLIDLEERRRKNSDKEHFTILQYEKEANRINAIDFGFQHPIFKKVDLRIDNVNNNLIASGFYTDTDGEEARGFFFAIYDLDEKKLQNINYVKFSPSLIFEVTGKDSTKKVSGFYSFEVMDVILRFDGGATVIAESQFDTEENMQVPSFTPSVGPSFRTINVSYYNDIIVMSVLPDGKLDWWKVLKKKQVSEDDEGFFSSYAMMVMNNTIRFIYNEEIYQKTNVNEYAVNKTGSLKRYLLFNSGDKNVLMVPRLGQQISSNEILIPSYRRNYLSLVKLTY